MAQGRGDESSWTSRRGTRLGGRIAAVYRDRPKGTRAATRPNILFIMTDDQPKDTMLAMPNVRHRIGDVGIVFNNGYVTQSLCAPSRSSILRGQYPHNAGVQRNSSPYGGLETFRANGHEQDNVATR